VEWSRATQRGLGLDRRGFLGAAALALAALPGRVRAAAAPEKRFEFAPRQIELREARHADAEGMAAVGGWWWGPTLAPGFRGLSPHHERFRRLCLDAKRRNPAVKTLASVRFELYARYRDAASDPQNGWPGYREGFRDEWIRRIEHDAWQADMQPWLAAGFEVLPGWYLDEGWYGRVAGGAPGSRAVTYVQIHHPSPADSRAWLRVNQVVVDLASPGYQDWLVEELRFGVGLTGVDGLLVGTKAGFWRHDPGVGGQELRVLPDGVWSYLRGGWDRPGPFDTAACLTRSPYGPGEYERGMSQIFVKLAAHGIRCVTMSRPPAHTGQWTPYTPEAQAVLLGEAKTPLRERLRSRLER
jgi:hypothetical protein